jgi:dsDNA-specific endonuclease/ATPase MutS2
VPINITSRLKFIEILGNIMTENEQAKHDFMLDIKRLEGMLERIDNFCHNYDQEKVDASVTVLKIKSELKNLREVIPHLSEITNSIDEEKD